MKKKKKKQNRKKKNIQKIPKKKIKIKYKNILKFFLFLTIFFYIINLLLKVPIQNIYITGNEYLEEEEIIKFASIENYPPVIQTFSPILERKLTKQKEIKKAKVTHKNIFTLQIKIEENRPLYFDNTKEKTILDGGEEVKNRYDVPILLNYIPDQKYKKYLMKMKLIQKNIIEKISEIKYSPNDKDDERFLLTMRDGNYVYLTLSTFDKMNHYLEIINKINKKFANQKGILYLDSGGYFEVME